MSYEDTDATGGNTRSDATILGEADSGSCMYARYDLGTTRSLANNSVSGAPLPTQPQSVTVHSRYCVYLKDLSPSNKKISTCSH